jgi:hypothetical protein
MFNTPHRLPKNNARARGSVIAGCPFLGSRKKTQKPCRAQNIGGRGFYMGNLPQFADFSALFPAICGAGFTPLALRLYS